MFVEAQYWLSGVARWQGEEQKQQWDVLFSQLEGEVKPRRSHFIYNILSDGCFIPNNKLGYVTCSINRLLVATAFRRLWRLWIFNGCPYFASKKPSAFEVRPRGLLHSVSVTSNVSLIFGWWQRVFQAPPPHPTLHPFLCLSRTTEHWWYKENKMSLLSYRGTSTRHDQRNASW